MAKSVATMKTNTAPLSSRASRPFGRCQALSGRFAPGIHWCAGLLAALACSSPAFATIGFVQVNQSDPTTSQSSVSATFTSAQTAGNLNVVAIGWSDSTSHVVSVTDSKGNSYSIAAGPTAFTGSRSQVIYYAKNIASAAANGNTVTVTFDAAAPWVDVRIVEYSGLDPTNPLDGGASASGIGATMSSGSVTTTGATDLLVGANDVTGYTTAPGTGYTQRIFSDDGGIIEDEVVTTTGSYSATATQQISDVWIMQMAAFRAASGDTQAPTAPSGLAATSVSSSQINLSWSASTDNVGVTGYRIERCQGASCSNFVQVGTSTATTFSDTALAASTAYNYRVRATDGAGNLSAYSGTASATTAAGVSFIQTNSVSPTTNQTTVSVSFSSAQLSGDLNVVAIGWSDSTSHVLSVTDSSGNSYAVAASTTVFTGSRSHVLYYAKNVAAAAANANTVTVTFDAAAPWIDLRILEYSGLDTANPLDVSISAAGTGTALSSGSVTTTNAHDLLVGANDVAGYTTNVGSGYTQRSLSLDGGVVEDQVVNTAGSYSATSTQNASDAWVMQMAAFKAIGGGGGDTQAPTAPTSLSATAVSSSQINLSWTASTDNVGVAGYRVERCQGSGCSTFTQVGTPAGTTFSDTGLTASTLYTYRVRATDAAGNLSGYSSTASATTSSSSDTTPPTAPTGLAATPGGSVVNLSWTASTDNVGVTGYLIERCQGSGCTTFAQMGTSSTTSYGDAGLTASTTYRYRVRATDAAGNLSAYSAIVTTTTTSGLSAPTGLVVLAASSSEIDLAWSGSSGGAGTISYLLERCSGVSCSSYAQIGTPPGTNYNNPGLSPSNSYSYRVRATDSLGDLSTYSGVVSYTTPAATPDCKQ
jgi:chitodextrinase